VAQRQRNYTRQIVVRVDDETFDALEQDAEANGRTLAQTVRFKLTELARSGRLTPAG
jgi:predicted HicB family RNase H-like nuclease